MALFLKNTSFHGVHLDRLMDAGNPDWPTVAQLMKDGIASGVVRPLKSTTFRREEVEAAFRFMAQGKHIGKVLIQVRAVGLCMQYDPGAQSNYKVLHFL